MEVIEDLRISGEIKLENGFETIRKHSIPADFLFILIDRIMPSDIRLPIMEKIIMKLHDFSRLFCISDITAYHLDPTSTIEEKVPIEIDQPEHLRIQRIDKPMLQVKTAAVPVGVPV